MKNIVFVFGALLCFLFLGCAEHDSVVIVNGLSDLNGKKIACVQGSGAEEIILEKIVRPEVVLFGTGEQALEKLASAEVAVAVLPRDLALGLAQNSEAFAVSDVPLGDGALAIVVRAFDNKIMEFWKLHDEVGADF